MEFNPNMLIPVCDGKCSLCNAKPVSAKFKYGDKVKVVPNNYEHIGKPMFSKIFIVMHTFLPNRKCDTDVIYYLSKFYKGKAEGGGYWKLPESILYLVEE